MVSIEIATEPDLQWNDRLVKSGLGTIFQTKEMASFFKIINEKPIFLKFISTEGQIVGQLLLSEYYYFERRKLKWSIMKKISKLGKKAYRWSYGPMVFDSQYTNKIFSTLCDFLCLSNHRIAGWEHPFFPNHTLFQGNKLKFIQWCTFVIDLSKSKNELFQTIDKHSGRKNIERARKRGVIIEEINEENLQDYVFLRNKMKKEKGENTINMENQIKRWKLMKPLGYSGFLAKKNNKPIGGLFFSFLNGLIIEGGVARSKQDFEEKLYSQDLIKWSIIEWGLENKMKYYNLAGANPNPNSKEEEGIFRYKKKWGGKRLDYYKIVR